MIIRREEKVLSEKEANLIYQATNYNLRLKWRSDWSEKA